MPFEKPIGQFMHPLDQYGVLRPEETILSALQHMRRAEQNNHPPHLIVVSDAPPGNETIQGVVTPEDMVFGISAPFLKGVERTGPIFFEGLLEAECRQAGQRTVTEIMSPVAASIDENEMLMEAVFLMNRHEVRVLPVTRSEEVTGIVHIEDIFKEVLERTARL